MHIVDVLAQVGGQHAYIPSRLGSGTRPREYKRYGPDLPVPACECHRDDVLACGREGHLCGRVQGCCPGPFCRGHDATCLFPVDRKGEGPSCALCVEKELDVIDACLLDVYGVVDPFALGDVSDEVAVVPWTGDDIDVIVSEGVFPGYLTVSS